MSAPTVVTPDELRAMLSQPSASKWHNVKTYVAELDRTFDSQREADEAVVLWRRQQGGEIRDLRFQVPYRLEVNGELICVYVADFAYEERDAYWSGEVFWVRVVSDAKGKRTDVYKLKKKLMLAIHGIQIREV